VASNEASSQTLAAQPESMPSTANVSSATNIVLIVKPSVQDVMHASVQTDRTDSHDAKNDVQPSTIASSESSLEASTSENSDVSQTSSSSDNNAAVLNELAELRSQMTTMQEDLERMANDREEALQLVCAQFNCFIWIASSRFEYSLDDWLCRPSDIWLRRKF
jgi:urocanate hydratase